MLLFCTFFDFKHWFTTYHSHYKEKPEMKEFAYNLPIFWSPYKLSSLVTTSSDHIIKILKLSNDIQDVGNHLFIIQHLYYKKNFGITESIYYFHYLYSNEFVNN